MANISGVIGLGLAKPKEYENVAMQQLAQANAARKEKAKYDKELADRWEKDLLLKSDDFKGLFPAQIEAVKNMSVNALEDFYQARLKNPNGYTKDVWQIKNDLMAEIQTQKEYASKWGETLAMENLRPEQEEAVVGLQNKLYGKDYQAVADYLAQEDNEFGTVAFDALSNSMILHTPPSITEIEKLINDGYDQLSIEPTLTPSVSEIDDKFSFTQVTETTPEKYVDTLTESMWSLPGVKEGFILAQKDAGTFDKNATEQDIKAQFREKVSGQKPIDVKGSVTKTGTGGFDFDFSTGVSSDQLSKLGIAKDASGKSIRNTRDKFGTKAETYEADVVGIAPISSTLTGGPRIINTSTGDRLEDTGQIEFKITKFGSYPIYNEYKPEMIWDTAGRKHKPNMEGLIVTTEWMDKDKGKYNREFGVEGIATIKRKKGAKIVEEEVPVYAPISAFGGPSALIDKAGASEVRNKRAAQAKAIEELIKEQNKELSDAGIETMGIQPGQAKKTKSRAPR